MQEHSEREPTLYLETRLPCLPVGEAKEFIDWFQTQGDLGRDVRLQADGRIEVR